MSRMNCCVSFAPICPITNDAIQPRAYMLSRTSKVFTTVCMAAFAVSTPPAKSSKAAYTCCKNGPAIALATALNTIQSAMRMTYNL